MSFQDLDTYSLPTEKITEKDIPEVKATLRQVLSKISESRTSAGNRADDETIQSSILTFQDWLRKQGCVGKVSTTYDIEATDTYPDSIFMTFPGQLPFDILFNMEGGVQKPYRLLIFITSFDLFTFASLVENKSIGGVGVPPKWPKDPLSYWEERP